MDARRVAYAAVLAAIYVAVGQVVRFIPNPMVPGAIIALNMTVVVIAGILFGPAIGALVGLVGTAVNFFVTGSPFEGWAIAPHTIMGWAAGAVGRSSPYVASITILVGHVLNIVAYILAGLLPRSELARSIFYTGLAFETLADILVIVLVVAILRPVVRLRPA